jgi:colicin import membrane protein
MLNQYLKYSLGFHFFLLSGFFLNPFFKTPSPIYYTVDFVGGGSTLALKGDGVAGQERLASKPKEVTAKEILRVDPKEDRLIKAKKKEKNKKEVLRSLSEVSLPIPSAPSPTQQETQDSVVPPIPGPAGSGFGSVSDIDFGIGSGAFGGQGTGHFPYPWYVQRIRKKLDENWNVKSGFDAKEMTQVAFTITQDGHLKAIEVEKTSGNEAFDLAALRAVEYSSPLPPLPAKFSEPELRVHVSFKVKK